MSDDERNPFNLSLDTRLRNVAGALEGNGMEPLSEIVWQSVERISELETAIANHDTVAGILGRPGYWELRALAAEKRLALAEKTIDAFRDWRVESDGYAGHPDHFDAILDSYDAAKATS